MEIKKIRLGKTGLLVTETAFGALPIQRISKADAVKLIRRAYDAGINYFDTANMYTDSEEKLGEALQAQGFALWVHNGGPEIAARMVRSGREITVLEAILEEAGETLGAQVDTGWVLFGGIDPAAFVKRLGDRVRSLHFKDMAPGFANLSGNDRFAVLGTGVTDIPSVFRAAPEGTRSVLVDQDFSAGDFFQALEHSLYALKEAEERV